MARTDAVAGVVLAIIAIVYLISAMQIESAGTEGEVGPNTFPLLIGGAMLVVSLGLTLTQVVRLRKGTSSESTEPYDEQSVSAAPSEEFSSEGATSGSEADGDPAGSEGLRYSPVLLLAATVLYLILLSFLGFVIPTAAYLAAGLVIVGGLERYRGRRLVVPAGFGIVGAVTLYVGFDLVLNVPLPQSVVGL